MICTILLRIERDAQLLANRIALLKQEEMKTWKKIDDTRKRTSEIVSLKNRNEERIQKVGFQNTLTLVENLRLLAAKRTAALRFNLELHGK